MECLISEGWKEAGEADIVISRQHKSGNYTLGVYLVDMYCLGVKDTFYKYNISRNEYLSIKEGYPFEPITYNEAHNIIYGAIAYTEDLGIDPHPDFDITQYVLEEDSEDIPLIEYEFGKDGKPFLVVSSRKDENKYVSILNKNVGEGNFDFILRIDDEDDYYDEDEDEDEDEDDNEPFFTEEMLQNWKKMEELLKKSETLPHTKYAYNYPKYPKKLKINHKELKIFFSPEYNDFLDKDIIDSILSLPHETLIEDLENIILYEIGRTYGEIPKQMWNEDYSTTLLHALFFLGELRSERSLNVILEILRQNDSFREFHFGDSISNILPLTLYYVGRNQLPALFDFVKEPGLDKFLKAELSDSVVTIVLFEPERRQEVIEWYRGVLNFYLENISNSAYYDAEMAGMIMSDLIDIKAVELLPEIKCLHDTNLVDEMICGTYDDVADEINSPLDSLFRDYSLLNIYERYEKYNKQWGNND